MNTTSIGQPISLMRPILLVVAGALFFTLSATRTGAETESQPIPESMFRGAQRPDNIVTNISELVWGEPSEGFQMSLSMEQSVYEVGTSVLLAITVRNVSEEDLPWFESRPEHDFTIILEARDGKSIPYTPHGEQMIKFGRSSTKRIRLRVAPQEALRYTINASSLYDLSRVGEYSVAVERSVWKRGTDTSAQLTSNTVKFRIQESARPRNAEQEGRQ